MVEEALKNLEAEAVLDTMQHEEETPDQAAGEAVDESGHKTIYVLQPRMDGRFDIHEKNHVRSSCILRYL